MIKHIVVFNLKHQKHSLKEKTFFLRAQSLAMIPEVKNFEVSVQVSQQSSFQYALSMNFDNENEYQHYLVDERHDNFVKTYWLSEVTDFMELDLTPL